MKGNRGLSLIAMLLLTGVATSAVSEEVRLPNSSTRANETALAAQQALVAAAQEVPMAEGTISKVNSLTGLVEVRTSHGISTLSLDPAAVKTLKVGQPVVVELVPRQD